MCLNLFLLLSRLDMFISVSTFTLDVVVVTSVATGYMYQNVVLFVALQMATTKTVSLHHRPL